MSSVGAMMARLSVTANTLRAYVGSDANKALVDWIDALSAVYKDELVNVTTEGLAALQSKVQQLSVLRDLVTGAVKTNGRI